MHAHTHPLAFLSVCAQMEVPDDSAGLIIGRGGSTIKAIQSQTGAHVDVPQRDPSGPNTR